MTAPLLAVAALSSLLVIEQPAGSRPVVPVPSPPTAAAPGGPEVRAAAERAEPPRPDPSPTPSPTQTIAGTVRQIETEPRRLVLDAASGTITVIVDRNTAVYLESGTGTLRDVGAGVPVRVSMSGSDHHAFWIEVVRRETGAPAASPPAMTRPGGTASPPASSGSDTGTGPAVPPVSPTLPPRAPPPSPPGPGPVPGGPAGSDATTGAAPKQ